MLVGELARRTGCTPRMIRHYERHGLLAGRRLLNGYRDFPPEAVEQVRRIRTLLDAGMDVAAAQPLLGCVADDGPPAACDALRRRVGEEIAAIDEHQQRLARTRAALLALIGPITPSSPPAPSTVPDVSDPTGQAHAEQTHGGQWTAYEDRRHCREP